MVKSVLRDFYETFFPRESQFELPPDYRNKFLDVQILTEWKAHRDYITWWLRFALFILILIMVLSSVWEKYSMNWRLPKNFLLRRVVSFLQLASGNKRERMPSNV